MYKTVKDCDKTTLKTIFIEYCMGIGDELKK